MPKGMVLRLHGAFLQQVDLLHSRLTDANLTAASLSGANLSNASLTRADLTGARLEEATLNGADLRDASLRDARLWQAKIDEGSDLSNVHWWAADFYRMPAQNRLTPALEPDSQQFEVDSFLISTLRDRLGPPLAEVHESVRRHQEIGNVN